MSKPNCSTPEFEITRRQLLAKGRPGLLALGAFLVFFVTARRGHQDVEDRFLGGGFRLLLDAGQLPRLDEVHRHIHEIPDHGLDVAAVIADLGVLAGLDLDERRVHQLGNASRDLGLSDSGGPDQDDVLGHHFVAEVLGELPTSPAVSNRDGHGALGFLLPDDVSVQSGDDFRWGELLRGLRVFRAHGTFVSQRIADT
jgi:hypothetical protein